MNQTRSPRSAAVLAAIILIALTACRGSSTAPPHEIVVRTAHTVYSLPPAATHITIDAAVTNGMNETLLLDGLGRDFMRLEKRIGLSWRLAYLPIHTLVLVPSIELPPGETRQVPFGLYVRAAPNSFPKFEYDIPGTYRAVFLFGLPSGGGFEVYSNEFELRQAD